MQFFIRIQIQIQRNVTDSDPQHWFNVGQWSNLFSSCCSDAELTYGSLSVDATEQMKEIGELGLHIWKTQMIEPLTKVAPPPPPCYRYALEFRKN